VRALEVSKPGPWVGKISALVVEWQLGHPEATKEECKAWLRSEKAMGRIDLDALASATAKPQQTQGKRARGEGGAATGKKPKKGEEA
jgi:tRNA nucleotidyltransferase (CCA-adding enzyme)